MSFKERLKNFREDLGFESKRDFSKELGVSENVYYMTENGARKPSKNFLEQLVCYSHKPIEFWIYGIDEKKEYLEVRENLKMLKYVLDGIRDDFKKNGTFSEEEKQMILIAAQADIKHLIEKESN